MSLLSPSLEAFWAVAQKGTVQEASHILKLTQTGVTQRIRSLEKQLKTTLFIRSRKGMRLTTEGQELLQYVKYSLEFEGMTLSKIQRSTKDSTIDICTVGPSSILRSRVIPNFFSQLSKYPNLNFLFTESAANSQNLVAQLKNSEFDFAIVEKPALTKELDYSIIYKTQYRIYSTSKWTLTTKSQFEKNLNQTSVVLTPDTQDIFNQMLDQLQIARPQRYHLVADSELATSIAKKYNYFMVADNQSSARKNESKLIASPICSLEKTWAIAWCHRPILNQSFKDLIASLKK